MIRNRDSRFSARMSRRCDMETCCQASRIAPRGSRRQLRASRRADHVASFARRVARITSPASRVASRGSRRQLRASRRADHVASFALVPLISIMEK